VAGDDERQIMRTHLITITEQTVKRSNFVAQRVQELLCKRFPRNETGVIFTIESCPGVILQENQEHYLIWAETEGNRPVARWKVEWWIWFALGAMEATRRC
jgi:hypothetical protein